MTMYEDNAGEYCGTPFIPNECTKWVRVAPMPTFKGKRLMKKKGRFGIWHTKHRYFTLKWFGATDNES